MVEFAPNGCLSLNAIAAFPDDMAMKATVQCHKEEVRQLLDQLSEREDLSTALLLRHESISSVLPTIGQT